MVDDHGQDELRKITDLEDTVRQDQSSSERSGLDPVTVAAWGAAAAVTICHDPGRGDQVRPSGSR